MLQTRRSILALGIVLLAAQAGWADEKQPDAVILKWEETYAWSGDGAWTYREAKQVRLNDERAYRGFADPRIAFDAATDTVTIHTAQVRLPDGTVLTLPEYADTVVTPWAGSGWPALGSLRDRVLVMPGIEPGCVVELDYSVAHQPAAPSDGQVANTWRGMAAVVEMTDRYPVKEHVVRVEGKDLQFASQLYTGDQNAGAPPPTAALDGAQAVTMRDLSAVPAEAAAPSEAVRLAFAVYPEDGANWLAARLEQVAQAAVVDEAVRTQARVWTREALTDDDKLAALQHKLAETVSFVELPANRQPAALRPAPTVLASSYATSPEAAALLTALAKAVDIEVQPAVVRDGAITAASLVQEALINDYVVAIAPPAPTAMPLAWSPSRGRVLRDARWAGHWLSWNNGAALAGVPIPEWTSADESPLRIALDVTLDPGGKYSGSIRVIAGGMFAARARLDDRDGQRRRIEALLRSVLPSAKLTDFTITTLTATRVEATGTIAAREALPEHEGVRLLAIGAGPAERDLTLPLALLDRTQPVRLTGPFDERVELTVHWSDGMAIDAWPADVKLEHEFARVSQDVQRSTNELTLRRTTALLQRDWPLNEWRAVADTLNALRTPAASTIVLAPRKTANVR